MMTSHSNGACLTSVDIFKADDVVSVKEIFISEWATEGNPEGRVFIKRLSAIEKERHEALYTEIADDGIENYRASLVASCLCQENGTLIFNPKMEAMRLGKTWLKPIDRACREIRDYNGFGDEAVEDAGKNSETTPDLNSSSDSPES